MRKTLLSGFFICCFTLLLAQSVPKFSYQAVIRNQNNELVANETVEVLLTFYNATPYSTAIYSEHHSVVSNPNGLIHLLVGEGNSQIGTLDNVLWSEAYLCTKVSLTGGYFVADTSRITASPYAYYADRIPLSAIQEHLGTAELVTISELGDSLSNYLTSAELQSSLNDYVPRSEFLDSLNHITNNGSLSQILQNLQEQIDDLQSVRSIVDEFSVNSSSSNTYQLSHIPLSNQSIQMYINGVHVSALAHHLSSSTLTYLPAANGGKILTEGDRIQVYYFYKSL